MKRIYKQVLKLIIVTLIIITLYGNIQTFATVDITDLSISSSQLYSATNTYNYNNDLNDSLIPGEENNKVMIKLMYIL